MFFLSCLNSNGLNATLLRSCSCDIQAMKGLQGSVKDMKGEGFFAADIKMPTGDAKKAQVNIDYFTVSTLNDST